jgi:hypothetical protein
VRLAELTKRVPDVLMGNVFGLLLPIAVAGVVVAVIA